MSPQQTNQHLITLLNGILADTYLLAIKTHGFHWNVTGAHFVQLHALFQTHYTELFTAADDLAERIRALGQPVEASLAAFTRQSGLHEAGKPTGDAQTLIATLIADHTAVRERLTTLANAAAEAGDKATEDLAITRLGVHDKTLWMLHSLTE